MFVVHYGSWFDHVKGWTDPKKNIENFFFITYEEMCKVRFSLVYKCRLFLGEISEIHLLLIQLELNGKFS